MVNLPKHRGFTLVELLIAVAVLAVILWSLTAFVPSLQRDIELRTNRERMTRYAAEIERMWFHRIDSVTALTASNTWSSGGIRWALAEQIWALGSSFGAATPLPEERVRQLSRDPWESDFSVFLSAARTLPGPEGTTLMYRDLWLVSSGVDRTLNSAIGQNGDLVLAGDDFSFAIDGRVLAERAVNETFSRLDQIGVAIQLHAQRRMLADPVRDPLRFYFASCSNSSMCDPSTAGTVSRPTGWLTLSLNDSTRVHATFGIVDQLLRNREGVTVSLGMGTGGALGVSPPTTGAYTVALVSTAPATMSYCGLGVGFVCRTVMQVN